MEISIQLPLDHGFLRRECPHCRREFKWWEGDEDEEWSASIEVVFCPYCGETARLDEWWTDEQLVYAQEMAAGPALEETVREVKAQLKDVGGGLLKFDIASAEEPEPPASLSEPHDMVVVEPPCHTVAPLKLAEDWATPVHCLVCGTRFNY